MHATLNSFWRLSISFLLLISLVAPAGMGAQAAPQRAEITATLDGVRDAGYVRIASDPADDLAAPLTWGGIAWTDLTNLYVAADAANLYVYVDLPDYSMTVSAGQIGLAIDVDGRFFSGGSGDPWANAITFDYRHVDGFDTANTLLPDYVIRGNIPGIEGGNGYSELREWDGTAWIGSGNWGGIADGAQVGTKLAYADGQGVEFAIPLADIGDALPWDVHLQFFATQGGGTKGAFDTLPSDDQTTGWDDATTQTQLVSVPLAIDPQGDLADPGPAGWNGVWWTDQTRMHVSADHANLYVFLPMEHYTATLSQGQILMAINTQDGGGTTDPWGNAIELSYNYIYENLGTEAISMATAPDYIIRGNIFGDGGNGWTELRSWNGSNFDTGGGTDWGGIGNTGQGSVPGSKVAWETGVGLHLTIPFADIGVAAGDRVDLQFIGTQGGGGKGAYDTVPSDDQSEGWDDATNQDVLASYVIPAIDSPGAEHDNNVWWGELAHDSRDPLYRTPGGPVPAGTAVTLRLRAASNDLTAAKVRVYNDRTNAQFFVNMSRVADDGVYEWWEATLPASAAPTIYWYRFLAIDGSDTDYYEDDALRTGGLGEAMDNSADRSWQLTMYDPAFETPDWIKNAIVYQIFPDRFRDGDPTNNPEPGRFFYEEAGGTIFRSNTENWNTPVCDPRAANECPGTYSRNFYGGDLQGLIDKLDYLQDLGITAIYLNPIFESPSNHKYDTTDFSQISVDFGDEALFVELATDAHARGMKIILDGVFNHSSSDSIYFDRYGRYTEVGACESIDSPYRDWYFFRDVAPGTGECVSSTGAANGATYTSWFGYDSLPKLNSANAEVRAYIWDSVDAIAPFWMQYADGWRLDVGGDVDPGTTNDPNNDYWEGFREAVHAANPDAYIVGEEWGNATAWTLGGEWDATMNYQYSSAMLGFWRDTTFTDNDHNSGSSAGELVPLTPSQLDERLHNWQERYAPEAYYAMMNLLGSHDTNRPLFMLDHNAANGTNTDALKDPNYDWTDAIRRLGGVVLLQMTLPGAPTVYYGDEVGLVGPVTHDGTSWQDDPYNRQPYPWLDESGTPYYAHLQNQAAQDLIRNYYKLLIETRSQHPALRTGSFDTLLVDDEADVYAYGRRLVEGSTMNVAVVVVNRNPVTQTVTLDVSGYLPIGETFDDALGSGTYTVAPDGTITLNNVRAMLGVVLVSDDPALPVPPAPVTDLAAVGSDATVELTWTSVPTLTYDVYRSDVSGGGYGLLGNVTGGSYTDTGLTNAQTYYYVVVARDPATGLVSGYSNEAWAIPSYDLSTAWYNVQWPPQITHTVGVTPTANIYGQIFIDGVTVDPGADPSIMAQVGFGPTGTLPVDASWVWVDMSYQGQAGPTGQNDEYVGQLVPEQAGEYLYTTRWSADGGNTWFYAIEGPGGSDPLRPMLVQPAADTEPPSAPQNLRVVDWAPEQIILAWDPSPEPDVYAYDVFRQAADESEASVVGRVLAPTTAFTDTTVTTNQTYSYTVQALDIHFNRSPHSNLVTATAEAKVVHVTFRVRVPDFTPEQDTVYIAGDMPGIPTWTPDATPMTEVAPNIWEFEIDLPDGLAVQYKYTRGSWDTVEWWGEIHDLNNRHVTIVYGTDGTQLVDNTDTTSWDDPAVPDDTKAVRDWRDPLIVSIEPAPGTQLVEAIQAITITWNTTITVDTGTFVLVGPDGPISGTLTYEGMHLIFIPDTPLASDGVYHLTISGVQNTRGITQQQAYQATFGAEPLPVVAFSAATYSVSEASASAYLTVTLSVSSTMPVTVSFATSDGTATAGSDYTAQTGEMTIPAGEMSAVIDIPILNDTTLEGSEALTVSLSSPQGATLGTPATATLTILDDDEGPAVPQVTLSSATYTVAEDAGSAVITVTLSETASEPVSVTLTTTAGSATAGSDYTALTTVVAFAAGETSQTVEIAILNDTVAENDETLMVTLSSPQGAELGEPAEATLTIVDDDEGPVLPQVMLSSEAYTVTEDVGTAMITVTLSAEATEAVSVTLTTTAGTATAGSDFIARTVTLTFAPGETSQTVNIDIVNDLVVEVGETFTVSLSNPQGVTLGTPASATLTIQDDDEEPSMYQSFFPLILAGVTDAE